MESEIKSASIFQSVADNGSQHREVFGGIVGARQGMVAGVRWDEGGGATLIVMPLGQGPSADHWLGRK